MAVARDGLEQALARAEVREHELRHLECDQVARMVTQYCVESVGRTVHVTSRPCAERFEVQSLASAGRSVVSDSAVLSPK